MSGPDLVFGADTYEIDRALSLARYQGDKEAVRELEQRRGAMRGLCASRGHGLNPQGRDRCVWCGGDMRPGLVKIDVQPYELPKLRKRA